MSWAWLVPPGEAKLILPAAVLLGLPLLLRRDSRNGVLGWWAGLGLATALTAVSKIAFYGWGTGIRAWDLTCFSGHTVIALAFWPVALALCVPATCGTRRRLAAAAGWAFGGLIGISRATLGTHPWSEVIAGALLGGGVAWMALRLLGRHALPWPWPALLVAAGLAAALAGLDRKLPYFNSERWFAETGQALSGQDRPTDRRAWRRER
ncbi:phosphatase PAP2 family protein [Luteimonas abyssi]|uniref:phosphatase PAP2 family protein n=1 Tax=Luteimonas abyssi TaxID=1247514 RepID=UPI000737C6CF|nr:phosphatase PAP2 family protein [Luteimonas abyssi]